MDLLDEELDQLGDDDPGLDRRLRDLCCSRRFSPALPIGR